MNQTLLQHAAALAVLTLGLSALGCGHQSVASPGAAPVANASPIAAQTPATLPGGGPPSPPSTKPTTAEAAPPSAEPPAAAKPESPENDAEPPPKKGKRPVPDRTPTRPGEAEKITFEDLVIGMQADIVFRPFMLTDRAQELDGKRISIVGYMHGGQLQQRGIKEFILLRNTECKFGPGGQADHLARIYLKEGETTELTDKTIKVEGKLTIEPFQGPDQNTWAIYRLDDAVVK